MKVTTVETVRSAKPIALPEPWKAAWTEPSGQPKTCLEFSFFRVHTDAGITGIGPNSGASDPSIVEGVDPFYVGQFWKRYVSGMQGAASTWQAAGLEIALWDIIGKAAGQPIYRLLGASRDRLMVYAGTSRLLDQEHQVHQVQELMNQGFRSR